MSINPRISVNTSTDTFLSSHRGRQVIHDAFFQNASQITRPLCNLAIYDKNDNLKQRFEYADSRMPVAMTKGSRKYYLHYDQVGSLRAVTDNTHTIIKEIVYDTYGNVLTDSNEAFKVPFGFAGGLYDRHTKLTRFGYRDYDAYVGKWTAKDPIGFSGGDSNLYGYVLGDPVGFFDPYGLSPAPGMRRPFKDRKWNNGPFGPICGAKGTTSGTWIPDITPNACQRHDDCYPFYIWMYCIYIIYRYGLVGSLYQWH
jgi:RHS repeat-associated protein